MLAELIDMYCPSIDAGPTFSLSPAITRQSKGLEISETSRTRAKGAVRKLFEPAPEQSAADVVRAVTRHKVLQQLPARICGFSLWVVGITPKVVAIKPSRSADASGEQVKKGRIGCRKLPAGA